MDVLNPLPSRGGATNSSDDYGYAEWHLQRREQLQTLIGYLEAGMITIRAIATKHVNLEPLLEGSEVFKFGPDNLPESFNVPLQGFGFGQ